MTDPFIEPARDSAAPDQPTLARHGVGTAVALGLWLWGLTHWPRPPAPYGLGFWAWVAAFLLLIVTWAAGGRRPPWRLRAGTLAAFALIAAAIVLRYYRIDTVPYAIHSDETAALPVLIEMQRGVAANILSRIDRYSSGSPGLVSVIGWLAGSIAPNWFTATRYSSAAWGVLSIVATYLLGRRLYSVPVALTAAAILSGSFWHLIASRVGQSCSAAFGVAFAWWLLVRGCQSRRVNDAIIAGIATGLALMLYDPVKVLLVAVPAWWIWHATTTRGFARATIAPLLISGAVALMTLAPLLQQEGWRSYLSRATAVTALGSVVTPTQRLEISLQEEGIANHIQRLGRITMGGATLMANHQSEDPLLNVVELGALGVGLVLSLFRLRAPTATVAPIWLVLTLAAVTLSSVPEGAYRLAVALPAFALLAASGIVIPLQWTFGLLPRRARAPALAVMVLAALGASGYITVPQVARYIRSRERPIEFDTLGRAIAAGPPTATYYVEADPTIGRNPAFQALTHGQRVVTFANLGAEVPQDVDATRPAVFAIPYWSSGQSVAYLLQVYSTATATPLRDPTGFTAGYFVDVPNPATATGARSCGLRRTGCAIAPTVDPHLAFLNLRRLCNQWSGDQLRWRGEFELPAQPVGQVGITSNLPTALQVDGQSIVADRETGALPLCLAPGWHSLDVTADIRQNDAGNLAFWWNLPDQPRSAVPCDHLRPVEREEHHASPAPDTDSAGAS